MGVADHESVTLYPANIIPSSIKCGRHIMMCGRELLIRGRGPGAKLSAGGVLQVFKMAQDF